VTDHYVKTPELGHGRLDERFYLGFDADIDFDGDSALLSTRCDLLDERQSSLSSLEVEICNDDRCALLSEQQRRFEPDTAVRS